MITYGVLNWWVFGVLSQIRWWVDRYDLKVSDLAMCVVTGALGPLWLVVHLFEDKRNKVLIKRRAS